jgi:hypothetical protein
MEWTPASKEETIAAIERDWIDVSPDVKDHLGRYLVEPRPALIERFGRTENAFVVAQLGSSVAYFDDVEEIFGVAEESEGKLLHAANFGHIAAALRELERFTSNDG